MAYDWLEVDRHIARNRIFKEVDINDYLYLMDQKIEGVRGKLPEPDIEPKMKTLAMKQDWLRPWGGNDYMHCPEMYCNAVKRRLETELSQFFQNYPDGVPEKPWYIVFPPADMIPFHDAIFVDGEKLELIDPRPEIKKRNWWDKDVLLTERFDRRFDPSELSAARRVDWYLRQTEKEVEKSDHVPLEYQDSSWPSSMRSSCEYPPDDKYSLQQFASGQWVCLLQPYFGRGS